MVKFSIVASLFTFLLVGAVLFVGSAMSAATAVR